MTVVSGRTYDSQFITTIVNHLTAIPVGGTEPYWKQVNSGSFTSEGVILHSKGSSGNDDIFVQIKKGSNYYFNIRLLYQYAPNPVSGLDGTFESATPEQPVYWWSTGYSTSTPFDYWMSFDRDRIMMFVSADKTVSYPIWGDLLWIGLPNRLSTETDSSAAFIAVSRYGSPTNQTTGNSVYARGTSIRNLAKAWNPLTNMVSGGLIRSVGWGGHIYLPQIFLDTGEGVRAIMHGVHPLVQPGEDDFKHGDEIMVGSKRYTIFNTRYSSAGSDSSGFPQAWMAVEQLR